MKIKEDIRTALFPKVNDDIKQSVISFANCLGGTLYVGIDDNSNIVGIANPDAELSKIEEMLREEIKPDVMPLIQTATDLIDGKKIILISVQRGPQRPYFLEEKGLSPEGVFIRRSSISLPATANTIKKMIAETDGNKYESLRSIKQNLTFETIKEEFSQKKLHLGKSEMENLGILNPYSLYTNLALLLSEQCEHTIQLSVFPDTKQGGYQTHNEFKGSLLRQLNETHRFLDISNFNRISFSGISRIDIRDYPKIAIFESLLNAIIHRDYSSDWNLLIKVFSDRIEFISPGGLLSGIKTEEIVSGFSASRNPGLAKFFYRLGYLQGYGIGIPRIFESYANTPLMPHIQVSRNVFRMVLPNINLVTPKNTIRGLPTPEETLMLTVSKQGSINIAKAEEILGLSQEATTLVLKKMIELGKLYCNGDHENLQYFIVNDWDTKNASTT